MKEIIFHISTTKQESAEYFADAFIKNVDADKGGAWFYGFTFDGLPVACWSNKFVGVISGSWLSWESGINGNGRGMPLGLSREQVIEFIIAEIDMRQLQNSWYFDKPIFVFGSGNMAEQNKVAEFNYCHDMTKGKNRPLRSDPAYAHLL